MNFISRVAILIIHIRGISRVAKLIIHIRGTYNPTYITTYEPPSNTENKT